MFDLALTERGDLLFVNDDTKRDPLKIKFNITNGKSLKIGFLIEDSTQVLPGENSLKIRFNMNALKNNKTGVTLNDVESKAQAIKIRLQTPIGDIANSTGIGSYIELIKHKNLNSLNVQKQLATIVKNAIVDIISNPEIVVTPDVHITERGYAQKLVIYIYDKDLLIFKYEIKG